MGSFILWTILVFGFVSATFPIADAEETLIVSQEDTGKEYEELDKWLRETKMETLNAPSYTMLLEAANVGEYRITHNNRVKLVLRKPQKGVEILFWNSRTLAEASEFIQLVRKNAIRSALVKNGLIVEILLTDKATR